MRWAVRVGVLGGAMAMLAACAGPEEAAVPTTATTPPSTTAAPGATTASTTAASTTAASTTAATPSTTAPLPTTPTTVTAECEPVEVDAGVARLGAERCRPAGASGPVPAALVLNGCGGYVADGAITSLTARRLAERGVLALRLDYLGAAPAPPYTYCQPAEVVAAAPQLVQAVAGALATLRADPAVDSARVGAVGYSLGGLMVSLVQLGGGGFAAVPGAGFGAIGLLSPVVPGELTEQAGQGKVPPLVLVVGRADEVVGAAGTETLGAAALGAGVDVELEVVDGQGHEWTGPAAEAAAGRLAAFVASRLHAIQPGERT